MNTIVNNTNFFSYWIFNVLDTKPEMSTAAVMTFVLNFGGKLDHVDHLLTMFSSSLSYFKAIA